MLSADNTVVDTPGIGTLRERSLHAALKRLYARPGDLIEVPVAGYVVDVVRPAPGGPPDLPEPGPGLMIEIQTGNFGALRQKLPVLLSAGRVRIVHPIARTTTVTVIDRRGATVRTRKSPRRGTVCDVFVELVSIPEFCRLPGLSIEVLLVDVEEIRRDGKARRGRLRRHRLDRRLVGIGDRVLLEEASDYRRLAAAPDGSFTTAELAVSMKRPRWLAQKAAYCLRKMGVFRPVGHRARAILYEAA